MRFTFVSATVLN